MAKPTMNTPWTESAFFEDEMIYRKLDEKRAEQARKFHEDGFLVIEDAFDAELLDKADRDLEAKYEEHYNPQKGRTVNLWRHSSAIKELATHEDILSVLNFLYDRPAIPFQTLNFKYGSRQLAHSDSIHFQSLPQRFMCGVWIALEDADEENGALFYYPGSHRWPVFDYSEISTAFNPSQEARNPHYYRQHYEPFVQQHIDQSGLEPQVFKAKRGDAIIWSANLIHGGLPLKDEKRTRWSQVTHYFFEDCLYYNPQLSNTHLGEYCLVPVTNIKNGKKSWGNYNGNPVKRKKAGGERFLISPAASKNWRDLQFLGQRIFHKLFS